VSSSLLVGTGTSLRVGKIEPLDPESVFECGTLPPVLIMGPVGWAFARFRLPILHYLFRRYIQTVHDGLQ
jgi:hypothetical protein